MEDPIIEAKGLNLWYGPNHALKDISVAVPAHEITAFIGPSGCGKSTFLRTLDRMNDLIPNVKITGEVDFNGENIYAPSVDVTWLRSRIGMVFQKANPFNGIPFVPQKFRNFPAILEHRKIQANPL